MQIFKNLASLCSWEDWFEHDKVINPRSDETHLNLKAPITTAADDKFCEIFPNFRKKAWYFMRIVCQQTILMKYHALFVIFEKAAKFEIVVCYKL